MRIYLTGWRIAGIYLAGMAVRRNISADSGVYFVTFTCARWLPLFEITGGYDIVYGWFDYLKQKGHYVAGYVIMPGHALVKLLKEQGRTELLEQMNSWVNKTELMKNKKT